MIHRILYLFLFVQGFLTGFAQADFEAYAKGVFEAKNGVTINYRVLSPDTSLVRQSKYPLVIFLHGSGERGSDNTHQLDIGGKFFAEASNRANFPSYVIFPQCPEDDFWSYRSRLYKPAPVWMEPEPQELPLMTALQELIEEYRHKPDVDSQRIYLIGLSMGGMAVYDMLCRHPEDFAAGISICGAVNPERLAAMKDVPIRIFHGSKDPIVSPIAAKNAYEVLATLGADVELIEFSEVEHNSWINALAYPNFLQWLFSHQKNESAKTQP